MRRREMRSGVALSLGALRERTAAWYAGRPNIRWCVSSFLWTSTQWPDTGTLPYTEMLDVIRDTGFDGFRLTGWPAVLDRIGKRGMSVPEALRGYRTGNVFSAPRKQGAGTGAHPQGMRVLQSPGRCLCG